jgi:hypothetical protein
VGRRLSWGKLVGKGEQVPRFALLKHRTVYIKLITQNKKSSRRHTKDKEVDNMKQSNEEWTPKLRLVYYKHGDYIDNRQRMKGGTLLHNIIEAKLNNEIVKQEELGKW